MKALAIITTELKSRKRAMMWWIIGVGLIVAGDMLLYLSVKDEAAQLNQVFSSIPAGVRSLFTDSKDLLSPAGFLSARVYYFVLPLTLIIFTIGVGASLLGKEEQRGTLELLLARPISRMRLLFSKVAAGALLIGILGVVALVCGVIFLKPSGFESVTYMQVALVTAQTVLLATLFGTVALACSALGGTFRSMAGGLASMIAFGSYILASLEGLADWVKYPSELLPYHYFNPSGVISGETKGLGPIIGYSIVIVMLLVIAWLGFRRRDIAGGN